MIRRFLAWLTRRDDAVSSDWLTAQARSETVQGWADASYRPLMTEFDEHMARHGRATEVQS